VGYLTKKKPQQKTSATNLENNTVSNPAESSPDAERAPGTDGNGTRRALGAWQPHTRPRLPALGTALPGDLRPPRRSSEQSFYGE